MTKEQKIEAYSMWLDGATIQEIADKFGVSFKYIQQLFPGTIKYIPTYSNYSNYIYPNIVDYIKRNGISITYLSKKCGISIQAMRLFLIGKSNGSKKNIDKILEVTGMKYEEAFAKEKTDET